jgi:hypothetical protein
LIGMIMVQGDCITIERRSVSMPAGEYADDAGLSGTLSGVPNDRSHLFHIQPVEHGGDFLDRTAVDFVVDQPLDRHSR